MSKHSLKTGPGPLAASHRPSRVAALLLLRSGLRTRSGTYTALRERRALRIRKKFKARRRIRRQGGRWFVRIK